ncbi:hypothetical protein LSTR_LSTR000548 [Laodelphax striatellus]|uniref:Peptidase S1 domain-containing protein n=1 Tax=Laodelphax striatellus TaxID=195883 RepID=A0A482XIH7_LAOST|nr:hypothetical protein LSTR_LSTR000548 [Laodelphax striatellus]
MKIDKMKDLFVLLVAILNMLHNVLGESPCPNVFDYEDLQSNEDRWYGVIYLTTKSSLVGVRLDIRFDRPVILMVSWMGEVTSKNSKKFTILSLNEKLLPGPPLLSRFMVKFDRRHGIPELTTIRLNGQKICPPDPDFPIEPIPQNEGPIIERPIKVTGNNYGSGLGSGGTHSSTGNSYSNPGSSSSNSGGSLGSSGGNSYSNSNDNYNDRTSTTNRYSGGNSYTTKGTTTTERYSSGSSNSRPTYNQGSSHANTEHKPPSRATTTTTERTYSGSSNNRPASHTSSKEDTVQMSYGGSSSNKKPQPQSTSSGNRPTHTSTQTSGEVYSGTVHKPTHTSTNSGESNSGSSNKKPQTSSSTHTILHNVNSGANGNKQTKPSSWETNTQSNVKRTTADSSSLNNSNRKPDWESNTKFTQTSTSQVSKPQTNQRPYVEPQLAPSFSTECGQVDDQVATYLQSAPVPLITNGRQTTQGQWPWHIAIYRTTGPESNYICGGTLITSDVVLTAAHCVYNKYDGRPVDPSNLVIYLGKYHLNQYSDDSGVQLKQVREMRVHPDYSSVSYAADIAILVLTSPTEYTTFVRPCCLWRSPLQSVEGKTGTVVGWGFDENKQVSQELKMAEMPVVSQRTCIESYRDFFERYASNRTYCAGSRTGVSACNGDSGGGMVFSLGSRWYLRGIVSIAVPKDNKICDPNHFIIFTDVAKYITWINENI